MFWAVYDAVHKMLYFYRWPYAGPAITSAAVKTATREAVIMQKREILEEDSAANSDGDGTSSKAAEALDVFSFCHLKHENFHFTVTP